MKFFEIVGPDFNGGTDETDHQVLWIAAQSQEQVEEAVKGFGWIAQPMDVSLYADDLDFQLPAEISEFRQRMKELNDE